MGFAALNPSRVYLAGFRTIQICPKDLGAVLREAWRRRGNRGALGINRATSESARLTELPSAKGLPWLPRAT
jgi:hypothetical protein